MENRSAGLGLYATTAIAMVFVVVAAVVFWHRTPPAEGARGESLASGSTVAAEPRPDEHVATGRAQPLRENEPGPKGDEAPTEPLPSAAPSRAPIQYVEAAQLSPAPAGRGSSGSPAERAMGQAPQPTPLPDPSRAPSTTGRSEPSAQPPAAPRTAPQQQALPRGQNEIDAGAEDDEQEKEREHPENDPSQDRTPPTLDLLRFEPGQVNDGGSVILLIQARDDLSGPASVTGIVSSPSGTAKQAFRAVTNEGDVGTFQVKIDIPAKAETGAWYVATLMIYDKANNSFVNSYSAANAPPGGTLRVSSSESDSTPPEVVGVWVEKASVSGGEKNGIRVELHDDRSGVASVKGAFQSPTKSALVPFQCHAGPDPSTWEGEVYMPANSECGRWTLQSLRPADNAGNTAILTDGSPQTAGAGFMVTGGDCDSNRPTLESLELSPSVVSNDSATEIQVVAVLSDEGHKAISVSGWVAGPPATNGQVPKIPFSCTRATRDSDAPWTGKFVVPPYSAKGVWVVQLLRVQDNSLGWKDYTPADPVLSQAKFEVR